MRFLFALTLTIIITTSTVSAEDMTWIVEIDGDPEQITEKVKQDYPFLEVLYTYDTLLQAVAIKGAQDDIKDLHQESWVNDYNRAQSYDSPAIQNQTQSLPNDLPNYQVESTDATGEGIKVGVIDTGIDYTHPDLSAQYQGGFDVIDFDEDPMESTAKDGMPTNHGTHVAGIIAANGDMKGVAPHASIYGYRALGPGGVGTSAHVLAALEQAVKDDMDIINLSLGTNINSPDTPLSKAVNQAFDLGHLIVVASGNNGPEDWTVTTPATAQKAITVGAGYTDQSRAMIEIFGRKTIPVRQMPQSGTWPIDERFPYQYKTEASGSANLRGKILMTTKKDRSYTKLITDAVQTKAEALIIVTKEDPNDWSVTPTTLPVIVITREEAEQLREHETWIETSTQAIKDGIAEFSARGPVTSDWTIKPDLLAPGVNVMSTIPGGYANFQGTSMAAPYVTGVLALLKQTQPNATPEELKQQLLSHANPFSQNSRPSEAGSGWLDVQSLFESTYYIESKKLQFGYHQADQPSKTQSITVHNTGGEPLDVTWNIPKRHEQVNWEIPLSTTIPAHSEKTFPIQAHFHKKFKMKGVHEGYLSLKLDSETVNLPYLIVGGSADFPRINAEIAVEPFTEDKAMLTYYVADSLKALSIDVYDSSFTHAQTITEQSDVSSGKHEQKVDISQWSSGLYYVMIQATDNEQTYNQRLEFHRP
ncbi:S8 family serine peptidase [Alkalibacillus almallahensis]|uniref:S8 family serine peptidase n=1 Tax=Alkalibacillus almallahensis TaxID=1379154 RepID=UPI0014237A2C|nr:S8 family serine peptidase [Alkalibacillus almallahensis]NIK11857.1 minor extracellular serine protease Vpr [Alkalibacillus almallahensis]